MRLPRCTLAEAYNTGEVQMLKRRRKGLVLFIAAFMAIVVFSGVCTASAETTDELNTTTVDGFMLWLHVKEKREDTTTQKVAGYSKGVATWNTGSDNDALEDVLKINDKNEYLIPVQYFESAYEKYGYKFDEDDPCPFVYAPDATQSTSNLTLASYVKLDNNWYVKVEDTKSYSNPTNPRSNVYYYSYIGIDTDTVNHPSSVINLFDYWLTKKDDDDSTNDFQAGINNGHALKFSKDPGDAEIGAWNKWTHSVSVYQGIVDKLLGANGYPALSGNTSGVFTPKVTELSQVENDVDLKESLAYLFDPTVENEYKESHRNVGGLLKLDKDGYYYYDSSENFAEYNEGSNRFTLYNTWGVKTGGSSPDGQFFPFNSMREVVDHTSITDGINHYFGMTLTTRFVQQYGGHTNSGRKDHTVFNFAGDDDVWIFIDDVLVADLGGIHDKASVSIDFATGNVTINKEREGEPNVTSQSTTLHDAFVAARAENTVTWNKENTTFADSTCHVLKFYYMERGNTDSNLSLSYNLSEIPETAIEKVDQYGNPIKEASFAVYAASKEGDEYSYITADGKTVSSDSLEDCTYDKSGNLVKDGETIAKALYTGKTDEKGRLVFVDDDGLPYSLNELKKMFGSNFILRETAAPKGYRLVSDEIYLYIANDVLLCDNTYESGVWASTRLLVTAPNTLTLASGTYQNKNTVDYYDPSKKDVASTVEGTLFAVPLKYNGNGASELGNETNWAPVYGNSEDGYRIVDVSKYNNNFITAVIAAAKGEDEGADASANVFSLSENSGTMQLDMTDLPGDINTYYHMLSKYKGDLNKTEYTVAYYWTSANSLKDATANNTYRIDAENDNNMFDRVFGATIEVPNLTNRLFAQKLDEKGELLNGAKFALYETKEEDEQIYYIADDEAKTQIYLANDEDGDNSGTATVKGKDGKYTYNVDANSGVITVTSGDDSSQTYRIGAYDTKMSIKEGLGDNSSGEDGTATFANMANGTYYMREIAAPEGYLLNTNEVMVMVVNDAVYANAGTEDDGVTVARGPGYIVSTLSKFASEGDIDNTLTWIYEKMRVSEESSSYSAFDNYGGWKYLKENYSTDLTEDGEAALSTYLKYSLKGENTLFNYTINEDRYDESTDISKISRRLYTTVGWSYYEIYQDYKYGEKHHGNAKYDNLTSYEDIANLFSRSIYVQVTDKKPTGSLEIGKTVATKDGTEEAVKTAVKDKEFEFTVNLYTDKNEKTELDGKYKYAVYTEDTDGNKIAVTDGEGNAITGTIESGGTLSLKDGQIAVIEGLPDGSSYKVEETANEEFVTTSSDKEGNITAKKTATAAFTNTYINPVTLKTGLDFTKTVTGCEWAEGETFTFKIKAKDDDAPMPEETTVTVSKPKNGNRQNFSFGNITYTAKDLDGENPKTFVYEITEQKGSDSGMSYDSHTAIATVTVSKSDDGTLSASVKREGETFTNTYEPVSYDAFSGLVLSKTLNGRNMTEGQFEFTVEAKNEASAEKAGIEKDDNEKWTQTVKSGAAASDGEASEVTLFENMTFTRADVDKTYEYTIKETDAKAPGYTYDTEPRTVKINVTADNEGVLTVKTMVTGPDGETKTYESTSKDKNPANAKVEFTNKYEATGSLGGDVKIVATKTLEGRDLKAGEFSFAIKDSKGNEVSSGTNDVSGNISFEAINYDTDTLKAAVENGSAVKTTADGKDVYTFQYTVSENTDGLSDEGITANISSFAVTATVTDNGDGTLTIAVTYPDGSDDVLSFKNTYRAEDIKLNITGVKRLNSDGDLALTLKDIAEKYTFEITGEDEDGKTAPLPETTKVKNDEAGNIVFGEIKYTLKDLEDVKAEEGTSERTKTFTYTVMETGSVAGVTNDKAQTFKVILKDNGDGTLTAELDPAASDSAAFAFTNTYSPEPKKASVTDSFKLTKTLEGREMQAKEFTFLLKDTEGKVVSSGTNDKDGNVAMNDVTFDAPGQYSYTLSEEAESTVHDGVTYDDTVYHVTAVVSDEKDGTLSVKWEVEGVKDEKLTFTNKYEAEGTSVSLAAVKTLNGRDLKDGEFSFELKDEKGEVLQTKTNDINGAVQFDAISYDKAGVYKYTVSELSGKAKNMTYDDTVYHVTVKVEDNLKGYLTATVDYDGEAPVFVNTYEDPNQPPTDEPGTPGTDDPGNDGPGNSFISTLVKTGDNIPMLLLVILMAAAIAAIAVIVVKRRKC